MDDEGTIILCDALRESTASKVEELNLANNDITPVGAKAVAALCAVRTSLTSLSLLGNKFDDKTVAMLLKMKEEKPALISLCGPQA